MGASDLHGRGGLACPRTRPGAGGDDVRAAALLRDLPDGSPVVVSACLLGAACRYDGGSRDDELVRRLTARLSVIPVCPESASGLPTPRPPAEAQPDGRILLRDGGDVSREFDLGARREAERALASGARVAVLKARSPSCGVGAVFDGTFTGTLRPGMGVFARMLRRAGVALVDELDLRFLLMGEGLR